MLDLSGLRRFLEPGLAIGESPDEPETKRGGRRVFLVAFIIATLFTIPPAIADLVGGYAWVGAMNLVSAAVTVLVLLAAKFRPRRFDALVTAMFVLIFVTQLAETAMFGGLLPPGLVVIFGLGIVLGAQITLGLEQPSGGP